MKFYSEVLNKIFDSQEELIQAETKHENDLQQEKEKKNKFSAEKKLAASKVEFARKGYDKACEDFKAAKEKVLKDLDIAENEAAEILKKANSKAEQELQNATDKINKAQEEKLLAINEFCKKYGPYKTELTKEEAEKEIRRCSDEIDDWLKTIFYNI